MGLFRPAHIVLDTRHDAVPLRPLGMGDILICKMDEGASIFNGRSARIYDGGDGRSHYYRNDIIV